MGEKKKKQVSFPDTYLILETVIETKNTHPHHPTKGNIFFLNSKWASKHKNKLDKEEPHRSFFTLTPCGTKFWKTAVSSVSTNFGTHDFKQLITEHPASCL